MKPWNCDATPERGKPGLGQKMAPISLKKGIIDDLAGELISSITPLERGTDNFKISTEFALSNFRFHRFLDVNSYEISRRLQGLKEKFNISCQDHKAKQLVNLKDQYLNSPFSSSTFAENTDEHFGALSLLLNLSESPVYRDYVVAKKPDVKEEEEINWTEYLLEGEEDLKVGIWCSNEQQYDTDDDDDDEFSTILVEQKAEREKSSGHRVVASELVTNLEIEKEEKDLQWLQQNVMHQYWKGETTCLPTKQGSGTELLESQMFNTLQVTLLEKNATKTLTEAIFVRETLWMLQGIEKTFVYRYADQRFSIRTDVSMNHLSQATLHNILLALASTGNKIQELKAFVADSSDMLAPNIKTVRSFGYAINCFLKSTRMKLSEVELEIVKEDKVHTFLTLKKVTDPILANVDLIFDLYTSCIVEIKGVEMSPNDKVVHIIDTIYKTLCRLDALGACALAQFSAILPIFLETIRPFLADLGLWLSSGRLPIVGSGEFFICEDGQITGEDSEAWRNRFRVRNSVDGNGNGKLAAPVFLKAVVERILLTGKSCGILEQAVVHDFKKSSTSVFEDQFYQNFLEAIGISWKSENTKVSKSIHTVVTKETLVMKEGFNQLLSENYLIVFQRRLEKFNNVSSPESSFKNFQDVFLENATGSSQEPPCRMPLKLTFESSLHKLINSRYEEASNALLHLLKDRFKFEKHLAIVKNFFLMEAGDVLNVFYSEVFSKLRANDFWQSMSYLTGILNESLILRFPQLINKLTVGIKAPPESRKIAKNASNVQSIDVIFLHYEMQWPLTVIFDSKAEQTYNAVFAFLLQVKRALWSLEQLRINDLLPGAKPNEERFSDTESEASYSGNEPIGEAKNPAKLRQRLYILRVRLMHFVQSFHVYIMTRILHTSGLEFKLQLEVAKDFEEILTLHQDFLEKVYDRCLLSPKVGFAKEAITRILNLSLSFQKQWDFGLERIKEDEIDAIEKEFDRCGHFIQSFLNNLIKRGSFPHLELLALSLRA